ncbi:arylesterase [Hoeflea sp. WL0058]|uniref:Arylesterase n=1 Tax=Flavimaribacter sediminis TaxID=2865987 RepID=A0AAE2ZPJ9_9HYPH|nr:arylesterase [Flavimaribacter sediminis]MBW8638521.1 arylesterase [Flavimaribacter sediminis]
MKIKAVARILLAAGALVATLSMAARAEPVNIVGFGDSLMAGYQLAPADAFPVKLEDALVATGNEVTIANAGVSGDTSSGGLSRLDWSVPDDADAVILELGANDALRGISPEKTRENLDAMIAALKGRGVEVLLVGMLAPPNMGDAYADLFNGIYPDLAEKYDLILYPFFLDGVAAEKGLDIGDGMHPNAEGVDIMVTRFLPYAQQLLERLEVGSVNEK